MGFDVEIQPQAFDDLDSIADRIKTGSSFAAAEKWFNGIMADIASLREMPERCILAPESGDFAIRREHSSMRLVTVFHVRHWARRQLTREEFEELMTDEPDRSDEAES